MMGVSGQTDVSVQMPFHGYKWLFGQLIFTKAYETDHSRQTRKVCALVQNPLMYSYVVRIHLTRSELVLACVKVKAHPAWWSFTHSLIQVGSCFRSVKINWYQYSFGNSIWIWLLFWLDGPPYSVVYESPKNSFIAHVNYYLDTSTPQLLLTTERGFL